MERIMAKDDISGDTGRAWELMKKIGFAMLVTRDGNKLRARPMSAHLERDENAIYFLTDARRHKDEEIARDPNVNLSFADPGSQKYVAVSGIAAISNTAPGSSNCSRRRQKHGGIRPRIRISAC
jgi:general stress protein 26